MWELSELAARGDGWAGCIEHQASGFTVSTGPCSADGNSAVAWGQRGHFFRSGKTEAFILSPLAGLLYNLDGSAPFHPPAFHCLMQYGRRGWDLRQGQGRESGNPKSSPGSGDSRTNEVDEELR